MTNHERYLQTTAERMAKRYGGRLAETPLSRDMKIAFKKKDLRD